MVKCSLMPGIACRGDAWHSLMNRQQLWLSHNTWPIRKTENDFIIYKEHLMREKITEPLIFIHSLFARINAVCHLFCFLTIHTLTEERTVRQQLQTGRWPRKLAGHFGLATMSLKCARRSHKRINNHTI